MSRPRTNPMDWPLDVFEDAADRARIMEAQMFNLKVDDSMEAIHREGRRRQLQLACDLVGLPPLFLPRS